MFFRLYCGLKINPCQQAVGHTMSTDLWLDSGIIPEVADPLATPMNKFILVVSTVQWHPIWMQSIRIPSRNIQWMEKNERGISFLQFGTKVLLFWISSPNPDPCLRNCKNFCFVWRLKGLLHHRTSHMQVQTTHGNHSPSETLIDSPTDIHHVFRQWLWLYALLKYNVGCIELQVQVRSYFQYCA